MYYYLGYVADFLNFNLLLKTDVKSYVQLESEVR